MYKHNLVNRCAVAFCSHIQSDTSFCYVIADPISSHHSLVFFFSKEITFFFTKKKWKREITADRAEQQKCTSWNYPNEKDWMTEKNQPIHT